MGKPSTASCFKIIACGNSDSVDRDDLQAPEIKGSSDRRGWSFRKRSARHRVLSNSVTSETPSGNKASPDSATVSFQTQPSSTTPEKTPVVQWTEEKAKFSTPVDSKVYEIPAPPPDDSNVSGTPAPAPDDAAADIAPDESVIIIIQAAIRGSLARKMLLKHKNIIKLQAAVRGHIVRKHAVGSLRCVQAIVKMQALVQQRRARLLLEELKTKNEGKLDEENAKENHGSTDLGKDNSETKPHVTYTSIEKLLSNRFARQLLESKPRTKTIDIKCDPSKSDSAWKWLERWMSVSSMGNQQSPQLGTTTEHQEEKKLEKLDCQLEKEISSQDNCESRDIKSCAEVSATPSEGDENVIAYDVNSFDSHACGSTLSLESHITGKPSQNTDEAKSSYGLDSLPREAIESDVVSKTEPNLFLDQSDMEKEQHIRQVKRPAPEEPETDGKKILFGLRRASNPAFLAAQSRFEELTSSANLARSVGSSNQDGIDSSTDAVSLTREIVPAENSFANATGVEVGGSECGTELSISSTLDSPDSPEVGIVDEKETNNLEHGTNNSRSVLNLAVDTEVESPVLERDISFSNSSEQERHENITSLEDENNTSVKLLDSNSSWIDQKLDTVETGVQMGMESEIGHQVSKYSPEASPRSHVTVPESLETPSSQVLTKAMKSSGGKGGSNHDQESEIDHQLSKYSPEASPRSHVTVPESQETPSSQVSMKAKKSSGGKSGSNHKRKSESSGKGPSDSNHNSGARNSSEQLSKDHKTGRRRKSFGSTKTDHGDHEPRDSSSSNSLPSYMQATESARAKALANSSPRSSPDVQDKEFTIKKRHSLPVVNTRQGSPRVQHSASQAQHGAKGNGILSPQERKWRR